MDAGAFTTDTTQQNRTQPTPKAAEHDNATRRSQREDIARFATQEAMKEVTISIFVANDGREFKSAEECINYEHQCENAAKKKKRLLMQVLDSRVTNLFNAPAFAQNNEFPPELFESFDHCEFSDEFRNWISTTNLDQESLIDHLEAFSRLGGLAQVLRTATSNYTSKAELAKDFSLIADMKIKDIAPHLESLSRLGQILANLRSEAEDLIDYYWEQVEREFSPRREPMLASDCEGTSSARNEEMSLRDSHEGNAF